MYLISTLAAVLDLVLRFDKRFCLLLVSIAVLAASLQGYALILPGLRRQVDPHRIRRMSFLRICVAVLRMAVTDEAPRFRFVGPPHLRLVDDHTP